MARDRWSRGDWIGFSTLLVTIVGVGVAAYQIPWVAAWFHPEPTVSFLLPREADADSAAAAERMKVLRTERQRLNRSLTKEYRHWMHTDVVRIALRNDCDTGTSVSVHYLALDGKWITEGWWDVKPGETLRTGSRTRHDTFYYHAEDGGHAGDRASNRARVHLRVTNHSFIMVGKDSRDLSKVDKLQTMAFIRSTAADRWGWLIQPVCGGGG